MSPQITIQFLLASQLTSPPTTFTYRLINAIDYLKFIDDLNSSPIIANPPSCLPDLLDLFFAILRSLLDHHAFLLSKTNKSSRTAPTPWITTEILSLKSARRRLKRTFIASHSIFDLKLLRSATNRYDKSVAVAKKSFYASLVQSSHPNLFGKLSITSYAELQIAPYPHHPLWLSYHIYLPHSSLIKYQSFISTYKPTPLPPQLILFHLHPSSTPRFHSCHLTRNRQPTLSTSLIHIVISIPFLLPY